jgi:amidase
MARARSGETVIMAGEDLLLRSARDQAALVRAGEVSSRELVEASLAAIERLDGEINAFVTLVPERALAEADAIAAGDPRPLAGVPVAIKDILALTEGIRTTFGMRAVGDWIPPVDSSVVRRLRGAGAIVVGKTNTPELGILPVTEPQRFGPTRNPWDTGRTAGGSSGGSAAAVAAGMVALAHGNDGGGSIRIPASCCGLVGLKPSRGTVSVAPAPNDTLGLVSDGVLSHTVADTALALDLLAGYELGDPFPAPLPAEGFAAAAEREPGRLRIGYSAESPTDAGVHPDCTAAVDEAARLLESLGHEVEPVSLAFDAATFTEHFSRVWISDIGGSVKTIGSVAGGEIDRAELEPLTRQMAEIAEGITAAEFVASVSYLRMAARALLAPWADHDVLVTPTLAQPPLEHGALDPDEGAEPIDMLRKAGEFVPFTPPTNVTGQPAISLPLHHSDAGLPIGVQLIGPHGGEELLLSLSAQLEAAAPWSGRHPPVAAHG